MCSSGDLNPHSWAGNARLHWKEHVVGRRSHVSIRRGCDGNIVEVRAHLNPIANPKVKQALALRKRVSGERCRDEVHLDRARGLGDGERDSENLTEGQGHGSGDESGAFGIIGGGHVGWRPGLHAELGGEGSREGVELMRVAACEQDAAIEEKIGRGMIHARDGGRRHEEEASGEGEAGAINEGIESRVGGVAPALGAILGAVDDEDVAGRKEEHVAHAASQRHGLHGP